MLWRTTGLVFGTLALVSCTAPRVLEPLTFQMDWTHEAEFTGFYVAQDQGFFEEAGLAVTLVEGPAGTDVPAILSSGRAEVAQMGMTMFLSASKTNPDLVAVMAVFQTSPRVLMTLADRGIRSPLDLEGLRLGVKSPSWAALVKRVMTNAGADPALLKEIPVQAGDIHRLYAGEVDVWTGFAGSEPITAELDGHPTSLLFADDYGAGGYDELLVVTQTSLTNDREKLQRFVRAVARGWAWAADHRDQIPTLLDRWQPSQTHEFHTLAWKAIRPLVVTGRDPIGWIQNARWPSGFGFTTELLEQP